MEYQIVIGKHINAIQDAVNLGMSRGWEPIGGIACDNKLFFQAMIKRTPVLTPVDLPAEYNNTKNPLPFNSLRTVISLWQSDILVVAHKGMPSYEAKAKKALGDLAHWQDIQDEIDQRSQG